MNNDYETRDSFDIREFFQQIKKYFWAMILSMVIAGGAGYLISAFWITPEYESAITMIVNTNQTNTTYVTNDNITSAQNLVSTYSVIIKSNTVLDQVIEKLGLGMTYNDLEDHVYVNAVDDTQVMRIAVRNSNPQLAEEIVNEIAEVSPEIIVDTVEAGSCKVISKAMTSNNPVTPNVMKNTLLMAAAGLLVSIIAIVLNSLFSVKRLVDDNDIQKYIDGNKKNNFSLSNVIFDFINKFANFLDNSF